MTENTTEEVVSQEENTAVEPGQEADPVATLTADLQRLQAEYANYRKRVERDRAVAHESAIGAVLTELLALLDDVDRAEQHGELTGGFKAVADQLNPCTMSQQMWLLRQLQRFCNQVTSTKSASCAQLVWL